MNPQNDEKRLEREKDFHDLAFGENVRKKAHKYYSTALKSRKYYRQFLKSKASGANTLEYGCGPGSQVFMLAENGATVTGIDISDVAINLAKTEAESKGINDKISFFVMNAEELKFEESSFDLICGTGILHHLNLEQAYSELQRVVKKDGVALFIEPLGHNPLINLYRKLTPKLRTVDEHPLLYKDLILAKTYFKNVDIKYFHIFSLAAVPFRNTPLFKPLLGLLDFIDASLFFILPITRKYAWSVVMQLSAPLK
ncbi:MAG: class I SAM-dependent methyltransferase [Candidatus Marinimicrobia bacterium]|nr:class I SAM-dependent methyltransferase [Candidatus Neomarinimicrobiota bacterium]